MGVRPASWSAGNLTPPLTPSSGLKTAAFLLCNTAVAISLEDKAGADTLAATTVGIMGFQQISANHLKALRPLIKLDAARAKAARHKLDRRLRHDCCRADTVDDVHRCNVRANLRP